jgi:hypothetical protein
LPAGEGTEVVLHPLRGKQQPLDPIARDRIRRLPAMLLELTTSLSHPTLPALGTRDDLLGVKLERLASRFGLRAARLISITVLGGELLPGLAEELTPPLPSAQLLGQLIPARVTIELILSLVSRFRLRQDLPRDPPKVTVRTATRIPRQPGPVDRDHPGPDRPGLITKPEHLPEQLAQRRFVTLDKPGDRRVIGPLEHRDHPTRNILPARPLNRPAPTASPANTSTTTTRPGHHRRVVRPPAYPVPAIRPIELPQTR